MTLDQIAKRIALWAAAFISVVAAVGLIGKWAVADPILISQKLVLAAVAEERVARVAADEALANKMSEIAERQAIFVGAATAVPGSPEWWRAQAFLRKNANRIPIR